MLSMMPKEKNKKKLVCVRARVCASLLVRGMNESSIRVAYRPTEKQNGGACTTLAID